jgi:DNA-binding transcriptional ArsR family regulator
LSERSATRTDRELVKALSHPLRVQILEELQDGEANATELAAKLETSPAVVAYHANTLVGCGCLEHVSEGPTDTLEQRLRATPQSLSDPAGSADSL